MSAVKHDGGKPRLDLLPFDALDDVGLAMAYGAEKYAAHNWAKGMAWGRLLAAALRHLSAWARGVELDEESGLPHLAHAGACVLMLGALVKRGVGEDDRDKHGRCRESAEQCESIAEGEFVGFYREHHGWADTFTEARELYLLRVDDKNRQELGRAIGQAVSFESSVGRLILRDVGGRYRGLQ